MTYPTFSNYFVANLPLFSPAQVEEHAYYDEKLQETLQWLNTLDDQVERALKELNADIKMEMLQVIIAEQGRKESRGPGRRFWKLEEDT